MKQKAPSILTVGLCSIITIFIVLTLAVFASLSLMTARSDYQLSKDTAHRITQLYEADTKGQLLLQQIDAELAICARQASTQAEYEALILNSQPLQKLCTCKQTNGFLLLYSDFTVNDSQVLHMELLATLPKKKGESYYSIREWIIQTTTSWEQEDSLPLFSPQGNPD